MANFLQAVVREQAFSGPDSPLARRFHDFGAPVCGWFWCTVSGLIKTAPAKRFRDNGARAGLDFERDSQQGFMATGCRRSILLLKRRGFLLARIGAPLAKSPCTPETGFGLDMNRQRALA
jgi:hypothetical protein